MMNQKVMVSVRVGIPLHGNNPTCRKDSLVGCAVGVVRGAGVGVNEPDVDSLWNGGPGTRCWNIPTLGGGGTKMDVYLFLEFLSLFCLSYILPGTPYVRHKGYVRIPIFIRVVKVIFWDLSMHRYLATYSIFSYIYNAYVVRAGASLKLPFRLELPPGN